MAERAEALLGSLGGPAVLVTHGITLRVMCALATGIAPGASGDLKLPQGSVVRVAGGRMEVLGAPAVAAGLPAGQGTG